LKSVKCFIVVLFDGSKIRDYPLVGHDSIIESWIIVASGVKKAPAYAGA
jgi:hypothetical protein